MCGIINTCRGCVVVDIRTGRELSVFSRRHVINSERRIKRNITARPRPTCAKQKQCYCLNISSAVSVALTTSTMRVSACSQPDKVIGLSGGRGGVVQHQAVAVMYCRDTGPAPLCQGISRVSSKPELLQYLCDP